MKQRRQGGFGLIEILITLAVIAFGILAHLTFQRVTFHEAGLANSRAKASELALQKLEDLRGFACLKSGDCAFAYQDITTDGGGNFNAGSQLEQPSTTPFTADNAAYIRHWMVVNYWYSAANSAPTTTAPPGAPTPLPDLKCVTVTMIWTDINGDAQSLSLNSVIARTDPAVAAREFQ